MHFFLHKNKFYKKREAVIGTKKKTQQKTKNDDLYFFQKRTYKRMI